MSAPISRRHFGKLLAAGCAAPFIPTARAEAAFKLRYTLASSMYGTLPLAEILPEVARSGAGGIDLWPKPHGSQREEVTAMGVEKFAEFIRAQSVKVDVLTRYDLGPLRLTGEISVAQSLGASTIVCGGSGPVGLTGDPLKQAVKEFAEKMKPTLALAEEKGVKIAIENHVRNLIDSPDSLRWLAESVSSPNLGIAFAPYHLEQDAQILGKLVGELGNRVLLFYAWEHGKGSTKKLPKEEELMQLPGRGPLDFVPMLRALQKMNFAGLTEIFMHPVPRGVPILDTAAEVTAEINRRREYLGGLLAKL